MTPPSRLMSAALAAASAGHYVFPVWPRSKKPAVTDWETRATRDGEAIRSWWDSVPYNIGIATGRSGLVMIDLDDAHGHPAPPQWPGARHGRDVLARLAEQVAQPLPLSTYTVRTPTGGLHLYYRAPQQVELRNTAARLGWRIDTRAHGGCIIATGSVRAEGLYRVINDVPIAPLPRWLVDKLTPVPPRQPVKPLILPTGRASAYVAAIVERETQQVRCAQPGTRHHSLLRAASALGRLVAGGELTETDARAALSRRRHWEWR
jgi:Bifunctional DNA primase/polymerase, N-terminal